MPPLTSHDFLKASAQRLKAAEALLKMKLNLDAQYLGGYTVECALKALILHKADDRSRARWLRQITRGSEMHAPEKLLGILKTHFGVALPVSLAVRMRRFRWSVALRYEIGRRDTGETKDLLNTCRHIYCWVKGELS